MLHPGTAQHLLPLVPTAPVDLCLLCLDAANTLHPGVVNTELARYLLPDKPAFWQTPLLEVTKLFALTPEQGAQVRCLLHQRPTWQRRTLRFI